MIFWIVFGVVIIIAIIGCLFEWGLDFGELFKSALAGAFIGCLLGCGVLGAGRAIVTLNTSEWNETMVEETPLVALKDNFNNEGTSFLFSSVVDETLKYHYIYEVPGKGMTTGEVRADNAYLRYEDVDPCIQKWETSHPNKVLDWLFAPGSHFYVIIVPEGSVTSEYSIDLE